MHSKSVLAGIITILLLQPTFAAELIMIDSRACGHCKKFHREVGYGSTTAAQVAPLRRVSPFKKWPADLAGIRPAPFTPVFIVVDRGREVGRFAGYIDEVSFWRRLKPLLAKAG
jgi:thioredoxin-related protein